MEQNAYFWVGESAVTLAFRLFYFLKFLLTLALVMPTTFTKDSSNIKIKTNVFSCTECNFQSIVTHRTRASVLHLFQFFPMLNLLYFFLYEFSFHSFGGKKLIWLANVHFNHPSVHWLNRPIMAVSLRLCNIFLVSCFCTTDHNILSKQINKALTNYISYK